MPGLVPGIHASLPILKTWMAGTSPAMTNKPIYRRISTPCRFRLIFMGTPDFAVPTLLELAAHGHEIAAVYTRAAKAGWPRHETAAESGGARGTAARHCRGNAGHLEDAGGAEEFRARDADAAVVVAYGMILPQAILDAPKLGCFNLHASLLPALARCGADQPRHHGR